jgi:microsomal dipeptidase-like Zn-dependent dipeptidase
MWAESADDIERAFAAGKIASMVGVESGYAISSNMAVLRTLYAMGTRSTEFFYFYTFCALLPRDKLLAWWA